MTLVWRCGKCRRIVLEAHHDPGGPVLVGYLYLPDLPAGRFVTDDGATVESLTAGTVNPMTDDERAREHRPSVTEVKLTSADTAGPLIGCPGGHVRTHRANVDDVLADLRSGRATRDLYREGSSNARQRARRTL